MQTYQEHVWRRAGYEALFAPAPPGALRGEATPFSLYDLDAHDRIQALIPDAKLLRAGGRFGHRFPVPLRLAARGPILTALHRKRLALVRAPQGRWRLYVSAATPGTKHWRVDLL